MYDDEEGSSEGGEGGLGEGSAEQEEEEGERDWVRGWTELHTAAAGAPRLRPGLAGCGNFTWSAPTAPHALVLAAGCIFLGVRNRVGAGPHTASLSTLPSTRNCC